MSKAFLRESDDAGDDPIIAPAVGRIPGTKNLITSEGARRLQAELADLQAQRQPLVGTADAETRRELQTLNQRIRPLEESLRSAEIAAVPPPPWDIVRFGATVSVRDAAGERSTYRLVGVDETDPSRGWVSWQSPIARALLNVPLGSRVTFAFPSGQSVLEVTGISYE